MKKLEYFSRNAGRRITIDYPKNFDKFLEGHKLEMINYFKECREQTERKEIPMRLVYKTKLKLFCIHYFNV